MLGGFALGGVPGILQGAALYAGKKGLDFALDKAGSGLSGTKTGDVVETAMGIPSALTGALNRDVFDPLMSDARMARDVLSTHGPFATRAEIAAMGPEYAAALDARDALQDDFDPPDGPRPVEQRVSGTPATQTPAEPEPTPAESVLAEAGEGPGPPVFENEGAQPGSARWLARVRADIDRSRRLAA